MPFLRKESDTSGFLHTGLDKVHYQGKVGY